MCCAAILCSAVNGEAGTVPNRIWQPQLLSERRAYRPLGPHGAGFMADETIKSIVTIFGKWL
jgi:hypothetical protein